jgi:serine/threonine protein kinase
VKPQNVLVDGGDRAYLADFGLTKSSGSRGITRTGAYLGSLDCVSPEQVRGDSVTSASDRYALAAVLYECLVGELPFPRDTEAALLYAHVSEPPPRVSERRPDLPATLDDLLARALAKEPGARYPTATQLVRDAQAALELRSPARTSTNAAGGGRPGFGETIVDPGLLRRAPAIAIEPERRFRTPPRLRRSRCSALVSPPRASCSGTVGPASSILHSASRSPARCP